MKIAFFLPYLEVGGIERLYVTYVNHLVDFYDVSLITCSSNGAYRNLINKDVHILELAGTRIRSSFFKLFKVLNKEQFDAVVGSNILANIIMLIVSFFIKHTKFIVTQHSYINSESMHMGRYAKFFAFYMRCLYPRADAVIAVSQGIRNFLLHDIHLSPQKVKVVYNSIDLQDTLDKAKAKKDVEISNYILYLGRMTNVKNIPLLIKAFDKIRDCSIKLCLIGDGPLEYELKDLANLSKKKDKILFLGAKSNPMPYIKNANCLVLPSFSESFGIVLLEAISLNIPVVTTPTAGALEIVSDCPGAFILNGFDDADELARYIERAVDYKGNVFASYAQKFATENSVAQLRKVLEE